MQLNFFDQGCGQYSPWRRKTGIFRTIIFQNQNKAYQFLQIGNFQPLCQKRKMMTS